MHHGDPGQGERSGGGDVVGFGSRRPPRRPWLPGLLLALAACVILGVGLARSGHHGPARPHHPAPQAGPYTFVESAPVTTHVRPGVLGVTAGWDLFARGQDFVVRIQLASGTVVRTAVPPLASNNPEVTFLVAPRRVIVRSYDAVPGFEIPAGGPARLLTGPLAGDSPGPLLAGPRPGEAWVLAGPQDQSLDLVSASGQLTGLSARLPPSGALPTTAISDGHGNLLLLTSGDEIYDAGVTSYRRVRAPLIAVGPARWLAESCQRGSCRDEVVNPTTGAVTPLAAPGPGDPAFAWPTLGVTSPAGSAAAVAVSGPRGQVRLDLVNLRSGATTRTPAVLSPSPGYQSMVWSPDSRWLFVADDTGRLLAVSASTGRPVSLGIPLPPVEQVAVGSVPG